MLFPIVLAVLAVGCGLLVERAAGVELSPAMLLPLGIATIVVIAQFPIAVGLEWLTTAVVVIAAVAGLRLAPPWRRQGWERPLLLLALGIFCVYAAPIVLAGDATFAGYIKLDDTSTWLAITDQVMENGVDTSGLASSTYEATLDYNLGDGYPYGVFLPLGIGHALLSTDVAWLIQPYMAILAVALALVLWTLAGRAVEDRWLRAGAAFVAAQPALLFGYYLWGGIKEMAAAMLLAASVALLAPVLDERPRLRPLLPAAVTMAALMAVLTPAGMVWLGPALLGAAALAWARQGRAPVRLAAGLLGAVVVLALPVLATGKLLPAVSDPLTDASALGNLIEPLPVTQIVGIWPVGDFRLSPDDSFVTAVLIAMAIGLAIAGTWSLLRRRIDLTALYVIGVVVGSLALFVLGSPWNGAKALAAAGPAILLAAGIGAAGLVRSGRRFEAAVVGGLVIVGVLWSNVLAYREVWLAPRGQLVELEEIGDEVAGEGPTLMTEYQPYGVRHFLRDADPEGASELRRRLVPLAEGGSLEKGEFADTDRLALDGLLVYRTLVLRRSPSQSRPPLPYSLLSRGDYYEVWQRPETGAPTFGILEHEGLGTGLDIGATASCARVAALAATAPDGALLVGATAPPIAFIGLGALSHPADWPVEEADPRLVTPASSGTISAEYSAPRPGEYEFWLGGSLSGEVELSVNGKGLESERELLNNDGQYVPLGEASLDEGPNDLELSFERGGWRPGATAYQGPVGPLVIRPATAEEQVVSVPVDRSGELCGRRLDWIEVSGS